MKLAKEGSKMRHVRQVVRISGTYYISVPKWLMVKLRVFRGSLVVLTVEGSRIVVETDIEKVKGDAWTDK